MAGTMCLAEDDHQPRNPRPVSPRTITNYGTRDMSRRGRSPTTEPETCLAEDDHQLQNPRPASSEIGATCLTEDGRWERKRKEEWQLGDYTLNSGSRGSLV